jgi:chromosome transmission fidelity protein 1
LKKSTFKDIRCVTLASRKNLCIHDKLHNLSDFQVTEECMNMQKYGKNTTSKNKTKDDNISSSNNNISSESRNSSSSSSSSKRQKKIPNSSIVESCPHHKAHREKQFADVILNEVRDIEDIVSAGKSVDTCPYYSSRSAVRDAQIVCLPYNMLLSSEMRSSLGISLTGNIVVVDEAHNLIETINQLESVDISTKEITAAKEAISLYLKTFRLRLNGRNLYYVSLLESIVSDLLNYFSRHSSLSSSSLTSTTAAAAVHSNIISSVDMMSTNDFLFQTKLDNINFIKLLRHIQSTNLSNKVSGFASHYQRKEEEKGLSKII